MKQLPSELKSIINNFYLDLLSYQIHKLKIKNLNNQLKRSQPILNISDALFDWFLDFEYAVRLPKLIKISY
jgi:hypothetical protein